MALGRAPHGFSSASNFVKRDDSRTLISPQRRSPSCVRGTFPPRPRIRTNPFSVSENDVSCKMAFQVLCHGGEYIAASARAASSCHTIYLSETEWQLRGLLITMWCLRVEYRWHFPCRPRIGFQPLLALRNQMRNQVVAPTVLLDRVGPMAVSAQAPHVFSDTCN